VIDEGTRKQREDAPTYINLQDSKDLAKSEFVKPESRLESLPSLTLLGSPGGLGGVNLMKSGSVVIKIFLRRGLIMNNRRREWQQERVR